MSDKNSFVISLYFRTRSSLHWRLKTYFSVRPAAHARKEPSKVPREAVSPAVSSPVRRKSPREIRLAKTQGKYETCSNMFDIFPISWPRKANLSPKHPAAHERKQLCNRLAKDLARLFLACAVGFKYHLHS